MKPVGRDFYERDTIDVARDLLGCRLVHETQALRMVGRIVETEAYDGFDDLASHAAGRITKRNEVMYGPPGMAYVYLVYGIHNCLNAVTREDGYPAAVLIRALEPVQEIEHSTQGPGRLCKALGIDRSHNRASLTEPPLFIADKDCPTPQIEVTPRIGVDYAEEWAEAPLRFYVRDNKWVSAVRGRKRITRRGRPSGK